MLSFGSVGRILFPSEKFAVYVNYCLTSLLVSSSNIKLNTDQIVEDNGGVFTSKKRGAGYILGTYALGTTCVVVDNDNTSNALSVVGPSAQHGGGHKKDAHGHRTLDRNAGTKT